MSSDTASLLHANRHAEANDLDVERWVSQVEKTANLSMDEREQQPSYSFAREVIAGKDTFCKLAVPDIQSYLPDRVDLSTIYFLATLDPINTGFYIRKGIQIGLSPF